jgi:hypothetical protein
MFRRLFLVILVGFISVSLTAQHPCEKTAREQAMKLLIFHAGESDLTTIDDHAKILPPIKNPVGKESFDVLEIWGYIYKAQYRMRFIFAKTGKGKTDSDYTLMGQEILELARL